MAFCSSLALTAHVIAHHSFSTLCTAQSYPHNPPTRNTPSFRATATSSSSPSSPSSPSSTSSNSKSTSTNHTTIHTPTFSSPSQPLSNISPRKSQIHRQTNETDIHLSLNLDGTGTHEISTSIPFLDHMLTQLSSHSLIDLTIHATGDTYIDDHHTNEDVGISLGLALSQAIGSKRGIKRFGHFIAPLDEALIQVVLDFSGRGSSHCNLQFPTEKIGKYDTELVKEFYDAVARNAGITLHVRMLEGGNSHHIVEASFKAFARALRMAVEFDERRLDQVPSSKGALSDDVAVKGNGKG